MPLRLAVAAWRRAEHDAAVDRNHLPRHVLGTLRAQPCDGSSDIVGRLLASERNQVSYCTLERKSRPILAAAYCGAEVLPYFRIDEPRRDCIDPDPRGTKLERERLGIGNNACLAHEIDGIEIQLDVTAPNIDAMPLLVAAALEPLRVPTARVVAKHVRVSAEFRSESVHRRAHLHLVSNVGGKSMYPIRDLLRRRRKLAVNDGNLIDDIILEQSAHDSQSEPARPSGHDRVFHRLSFRIRRRRACGSTCDGPAGTCASSPI